MIRSAFAAPPASRIIENLYQGGYPIYFNDLLRERIDLLVLAAKEVQPPDAKKLCALGITVLAAPLLDDVLTFQEAKMAEQAAKIVAHALRKGKRVLVTCAMGMNRSGLITALALMKTKRLSGKEAIAHIRTARPGALSNSSFSAFLDAHANVIVRRHRA